MLESHQISAGYVFNHRYLSLAFRQRLPVHNHHVVPRYLDFLKPVINVKPSIALVWNYCTSEFLIEINNVDDSSGLLNSDMLLSTRKPRINLC